MQGEGFLKTSNIIRKYAEQSTFTRNIISTFFVQVLSLFLSIGTASVIARWLGPEGKGLFSLTLLIPGLLVAFLNSGIGVANVYFLGSRRIDVPTLMANSLTIAGIATVVSVGIISILWTTGWAERLVPEVPLKFVLIAMAGLPVGLLSSYFGSILQGLHRITRINAVGLFQSCFTLALTILLVVGFKLGVIGALIAAIAAGIFAITGLGYLLNLEGGKFTPRWNFPVIKTTLIFGLKGHIGNLFQFLNYRLDMFFVNYFLGPAGVGIYSVSVGLAELLWYLPNAVGFVVFPKAASTQPEVMNLFIPRVFRIVLGLTALGAVGLLFLGRPIIQWVFSSSFDSAYFPMVVLLPGVVLLGGAKVLSNDIAGRGYPQYNSINASVAVILTLILDLVLIPSYGVLGAAIASSISYSIIFLAALCFHRIVSRRIKGVLFA